MFWFMVGIIVGFLLSFFIEVFDISPKMKYSWECENCDFTIRTDSTNSEVIERIIADHKMIHF